MKEREPRYAAVANQVATGAEMGALLEHGSPRTARRLAAGDGSTATSPHGSTAPAATRALTHPPRPRKRRRR
jgi:hypothetical protein